MEGIARRIFFSGGKSRIFSARAGKIFNGFFERNRSRRAIGPAPAPMFPPNAPRQKSDARPRIRPHGGGGAQCLRSRLPRCIPQRPANSQIPPVMSSVASLKELLVEELKDLYSAEKQLVKALPKMAKAASNPDLQQGFTDHLEETRGHVERLEQAFRKLDTK